VLLGFSRILSASLNNATVYSRALARACEILGGAEQLAARLGISPALTRAYVAAVMQPPQHIFLKAVDIISRYDEAAAPPPGVPSHEEDADRAR
jgi:hypothetical protein